MDGAPFTRLRSTPHTALQSALALVLAAILALAVNSRAEARLDSANVGTVTTGRAALDGPGVDHRGAPEQGRKFVPGELLVRFRSGVGARARSSVLDALDATTKRRLPLPGLRLVRIGGGESVPEAVASFERRAEVRYAEPNFIYRIEATPNDPRFGELWGLDNSGQTVNGTAGNPDADIDAPEAWDTTTGSSAVTVAVVDTGVDNDHPDLSPNIRTNPGESGLGKESNGVDDDGNGYVDDWRGWDFIDSDNDPGDLHHHGTHVAGTIGARGEDGSGIVGVSWRVGLLPVRVLDAGGFGTNATVTAGFAYAGANGAKVVNASLGGSAYSQSMADAIASSPSTLFVVSAGNDASNNDAYPQYPCNYTASNLVCVAATTQSDGLAGFSDYGAGSVDLGAPGTNVLSAYPQNEFSFLSGTSMATPHVAGAAALLWAQGPGISPDLVKSTLLSSVDPLPALEGKTVSGGRLNVYRALGGSPPFPPNPYGGPEIPVNTTTAGYQYQPTIAPDPGGGFTVAWSSGNYPVGQDGDGLGVYARRFDGAGAPLGGEIPVNLTTAGNQGAPAIAPDPGGGFTVAWKSFGYDGSGRGSVYARRFDAAGAPLGGEIAVNPTTAGAQDDPAIAPAPGGGFTVAWSSYGQDGPDYGVYARRFDGAGAPLGGEIAVNLTTAGDQRSPAIAPDPGGGFTVAWSSQNYSVYARRFDAAGAPLGGEIPVSLPGGSSGTPAIVPDGAGGFIVTWAGSWAFPGLHARHFDAAGAPLGGEIAVGAGSEPAIATDPGGGFTVAWQSADDDTQGVYARRFDGAGAPLGGEIAVNLTAADAQVFPAIAPDPGGGFTVAWESRGQDGSDSGVYARRFAETPDTSIDSGPAGPTNDVTPTFAFSSNEQGASFQCRLDGAGFQSCSSPHTTDPLTDGPHAFEVRAVDPDQTRDPTPARRAFTVDTAAPETQIDAGPSPLTNNATPSFDFSSSERGSTFECRFDSDPFAACSGPGASHTSASDLADGPHSFEVRATDKASNTDPTPAARSFTIDTTATPPGAPQVTDTDPDSPANDNNPEVKGTLGSGSPTEVKIYRNQDCSGNPNAAGTVAEFTGAGITINVPDDATTSLSAAASDSGIDSACSPSLGYTEDSTNPKTTIDSGPPVLTNDPTPSFAFSSNEQGASFRCRVDGGAFSVCSSPLTTAPLADGSHSFEVRAIDQATNTDPTPAARNFTVELTPPELGEITEFTAGLNPGSSPGGIAPGPDGNLWFTDPGGTQAIGRITPSGTIAEFTAGLNPSSSPGAIAPGPDGNLWFTDRGSRPAIGRITPGGTITEFFLPGNRSPSVIAPGPDGNLWFTDPGVWNNGDPNRTPAIGRITPSGTITEFSTGLNAGSFPLGITPGPDGNLWFTDAGAIGRITPGGAITEFSDGLNEGSAPAAIAPGPDGNLWFTDSGVTRAIGRITPGGAITEFSDGLSGEDDAIPRGIAPGPDGNLWFTWMGLDHLFSTSAIGRITPDGTINLFVFGPKGFPGAIAPGADGNLWFTEVGGASGAHPAIGRIGTGAPGPSLVAPSVTGTGEEGTEQVCEGDLWASWAGEQPVQNSPDASPPGVQWLRDGVPLAGETAQSFTPVDGDGGHLLACTVAVTYPLLKVTASATSDPVTLPPNSSIDSGPLGPTNDPTPTFSFSSDEQGASFQCRLDSSQEADFQPCTSPFTSDPLPDGPHSFEVRAIGAADNPDPTPASRSFTVDTVPPGLAILSGPSGPTNDPSPTFGFSAEAGSSVKCSVDTGTASFGACSGASTHSPTASLADGSYTFRVRATDAAGNSSTQTRAFSVDTTPPDASIDSGPSGPTNDPTPTFSFSSSEAGASFECRLDGGGFSACSSPHTTSPLTDGPHTFEVRAIDEAGNPVVTLASRSFTVDTTPPDTSIDSGPSGPTNDPTPTFSFSSSEQAASFQCRLDSSQEADFQPCNSPHTVGTLSEGPHSFEVRAIDAAANLDPTPASRSFSVDTVPPSLSILSGPSGPTNDPSPSFGFSAEAGSTVQCSIDTGSAGFAACSGSGSDSPSAPLADGPYTFRVRATDAAGNSSTQTRSFSVDTMPPDTRIDSGPQGDTTDPNPSFAFSTALPEPGASFQCRLDSAGASDWQSCTSPKAYSNLPLGAHLFEVRAADAPGNQDQTPDSRSFTIQPGLPPPQPQEPQPSAPQPSAPQPSAQPSFNLAKAIRRCRKKFDGNAERRCIQKARAKARA